MDRHFQVYPEMFYWVKVSVLAGQLKDIQKLVLRPPQHYIGCLIKVIVLMEGETSAQSEVLSALA